MEAWQKSVKLNENILTHQIPFQNGKKSGNQMQNFVRTFVPALLRGDKERQRSFANPEVIESFNSGQNGRLEDNIKLDHLKEIMQEFEEHDPSDIIIQDGSGYFPPKVKKRTPGSMNIDEFKETVSRVLKTDDYDEYLSKLFTKLDTSCDGYVDWNEFCTYMLLQYREKDYLQTKREIPFVIDPQIRHIVHNRQETTTRILSVENPTRFITISKEGAMSVWQPNMAFEKHYLIREDDDETSNQKRRFHMWITDAIYMPNCNKIAIASTSRDIRFYDVSTSQYFEEFHLFSMADVPYCFDYWYNPRNPNSKSLLIAGVDSGAIHLFYFHAPVSKLFETPFKHEGGSQKIFMQDIAGHSKFITHSVIPEVHTEIVRQVQYLPENDAIVSCCLSSYRSLVISDVQKVKKAYVFKIEKGVECFDHSKDLNILITGSSDHLIRVWNSYVTCKPITILQGHSTGVIGVAIQEELMQVFSYSKDGVVKVWDIKEHTCLQTIHIKFPSSIHGKMPENGQFPVYLKPQPNNCLLVTNNDYVAMLKLGKIEPPKNTAPTTHDTQLCCAIYNPFLKQVATGCDASCVAAWDIETGQKSIVFSNTHGNDEITAMAFDQNYRRLITGARNGTIKVWNFQNGHNLHKLEPVAEAEVTGIVPLGDKKIIMAVGWSQLITQYDDSDADNMYIKADTSWKGGQLHKDDILSVDFVRPYFVATAGFDGEIIVWDLETEKIFNRLRKGKVSDIAYSEFWQPRCKRKIQNRTVGGYKCFQYAGFICAKKIEFLQATENSKPKSRPNSRHRLSHKVMKGQVAPVDKLMFLKARVGTKSRDSAILVSSEGGILRWWCPYLHKPEIGYFYAAESVDESVLAMCSNERNSILVTGDTLGFIKVWSIGNYCTKVQQHKIKESPPLECIWHAHDSAVVSMDFIHHDDGDFIVSASTDKTARLWNLEGHFVGTFGQKQQWNLRQPSTWMHPETPWSDEVKPTEVKFIKEETVESEEETEIESQTAPQIKSEHTSLVKSIPDETFLGTKVEDHLLRVKEGRKCRRSNYGAVNADQTSRYGKICSPYHALITPSFEDTKIPQNLPLSQRMINRGYEAQSLTEDQLKEMNFDFGATLPADREGSFRSQQDSKKESFVKFSAAGSTRTSRSSTSQLPSKKVSTSTVS